MFEFRRLHCEYIRRYMLPRRLRRLDALLLLGSSMATLERIETFARQRIETERRIRQQGAAGSTSHGQGTQR